MSKTTREGNSTLIYACSEGFTKVGGDNILYCTKNKEGQWRGDQFICEKNISVSEYFSFSVYFLQIKILTNTYSLKKLMRFLFK